MTDNNETFSGASDQLYVLVRIMVTFSEGTLKHKNFRFTTSITLTEYNTLSIVQWPVRTTEANRKYLKPHH